MPWNIVHSASFFNRSVACIFALGNTLAWAKPAFEGLEETHLFGSDLYPSQGDLYDVVNRKRPHANHQTPHRPDFFGVDAHWIDLGAHNNYQGMFISHKFPTNLCTFCLQLIPLWHFQSSES
jgi:hypothetical protein